MKIKLLKAEYEEIRRQAEIAGLSVTGVIRRAVKAYSHETPVAQLPILDSATDDNSTVATVLHLEDNTFYCPATVRAIALWAVRRARPAPEPFVVPPGTPPFVVKEMEE